jgi:hypothetical protein
MSRMVAGEFVAVLLASIVTQHEVLSYLIDPQPS